MRLAYGEMCCAPWMSWMRRPSTPTVENVMLLSTSSVCTLAVHDSSRTKSAFGSSMYSLGPPLSAKSWAPLRVQVIVKLSAVRSIGPLKVNVTLLSSGTSFWPLAGFVEVTATGGGLLRGFGGPTVKSAALLSVSTAPPPLRSAAVVLVRAGVGAVSDWLAAP